MYLPELLFNTSKYGSQNASASSMSMILVGKGTTLRCVQFTRLKKQSASILLQARGILSTLIIAELFADAI
jgi:hypothetical protein